MTAEKSGTLVSPRMTSPDLDRGNRHHPTTSGRAYWVLTQLRLCVETFVGSYFSDRRSSVVLDYGCGNMPYRSLFSTPHYLGADFAGNSLAGITLSPTGAVPMGDGECDLVLSTQVLEHVVDVSLYLSEARRVLRTDGLLFLSTHGVWRYHPDPADYWRWTSDGLRRIVSQAGFGVLECRGILGPEATALQLYQDAVVDRVPGRLRPVFAWFMQRRIRSADRRCPSDRRDRDACVFALVARRTN